MLQNEIAVVDVAKWYRYHSLMEHIKNYIDISHLWENVLIFVILFFRLFYFIFFFIIPMQNDPNKFDNMEITEAVVLHESTFHIAGS